MLRISQIFISWGRFHAQTRWNLSAYLLRRGGQLLWNFNLHTVTNKMKLIYACSKTTPSKSKLTVPNKELCPLLLGSQKEEYLRNIINIPEENISLHSYSMVPIFWWSRNPEKLNVYVVNRAKNIKQINFTLLHIPGNETPADYTTKITSVNKYLNTEFKQNGPKLLRTYTNELNAKPCPLSNLKKWTRVYSQRYANRETFSHCTKNVLSSRWIIIDSWA